MQTLPFHLSFYGEVNIGSLLERDARQFLLCNLDEVVSRITGDGLVTTDTEMEVESYSSEAAVGQESAGIALKAAANLARLSGYAVVIFSPGELEGVEPTTLQNRLVELGNQAIEDLKE